MNFCSTKTERKNMTDVTLIRPHVNPSDDFDERHQATMEVFNTERAPQLGDWGICLGGDASAAIGGQMMVFSWFESRDALLAAVNEHLIYTFLPPQRYDLSAAQRRLTDALIAFSAHDDALRLAEDIRNSLRSHVRIDWIGPVSQLMTGDDEFARSVRADFLELEDVTSAAEIDEAQEAEFRDFLSCWISGG